MAEDSSRWDAEEGVPEVVVCFGCGKAIEEFDALECAECSEFFCSETCRTGHECHPHGGPARE